jgi:hypothetical protein
MQGDGRPNFFLEACQESGDKIYMIIRGVVEENLMSKLLELGLVIRQRSSLLQSLQRLQLLLVLILVIFGEHQFTEMVLVGDPPMALHGLQPGSHRALKVQRREPRPHRRMYSIYLEK